MSYPTTNSENAQLLSAIINETSYAEDTNSRNATILKSIIDETEYTDEPQSEIEELLLELKDKIESESEIEALTVTENGTYSESGVAYSPVTVALPLDSKSITSNGTYSASDDELEGYSSVTVAVEGYTTATASGNPITLTDASELPLLECKATIEATQDLNGYSKPWAGGSGKNIIPSKFYSRNARTILLGVDADNTFEIYLEANTTYTLSFDTDITTAKTLYYKTETSTALSVTTTGSVFTFTPTEAGYYIFVLNSVYTDITASDISNLMLEVGSTATDYEPYSNICPISGVSSVSLTHNDDTITQALSTTCYGGSYDFASGEEITEYGFVTLDETDTWVMYTEGKFYCGAIEVTEASISTNYTSNMYEFYGDGNYASSQVTVDQKFYGQRQYGRFWVYDSNYTTLDAWLALLAETPLEIRYPLTTPTTTQLSAHQVVMEGSDTLSVDTTNLDITYFKEV